MKLENTEENRERVATLVVERMSEQQRKSFILRILKGMYDEHPSTFSSDAQYCEFEDEVE